MKKEVIFTMRQRKTVTLSSDYQIKIPPKACEIFGLRSGEKLEMTVYDGRIELIPIRSAKSFRGIAKGVNTSLEREKDRL
jgi:AbrB family looped-hinge helix DNA binding protein